MRPEAGRERRDQDKGGVVVLCSTSVWPFSCYCREKTYVQANSWSLLRNTSLLPLGLKGKPKPGRARLFSAACVATAAVAGEDSDPRRTEMPNSVTRGRCWAVSCFVFCALRSIDTRSS